MPDTRVPATEITGPFGALLKRLSRKQFGKVPDALGVMWHHRPMLRAFFALGGKVERWDRCDASLKSFAHMAVAAQVGCSACLDIQYYKAHNHRLDVEKAREVPRWRESDLFTPLERDVMEYSEAMTQTPPTVTDELSARLLDALGAPGLVELTGCAAVANMMARANTALGIEAEGLAASCELRPLAQPTRAVASAA